MRILFLTGTRADYGKLKSLLIECEKDSGIELFIFVCGMHLSEEHGLTYKEIQSDGYKNIYISENCGGRGMDEKLAETVLSFSKYAKKISPDLIVVHGDRAEPLSGAIIGVLNNIKVAHIEGGEITGTADEFMRHAVSKLSSVHFVSNSESKFRLIQMGEQESSIHIIGSPDIDIMLSENLPDFDCVRSIHGIDFTDYAVCIYHPVTTSENLTEESEEFVNALVSSELRYIVIYPNNDLGADIVLSRFERLKNNKNFLFFKSLPFEDFLVLLKKSRFIIGNSSAGVREACVYGIPAIDVGTRQNKRYNPAVLKNIQHTDENCGRILKCIEKHSEFRYKSNYFGSGGSAELFISSVKNLCAAPIQKSFVDLKVTSDAIQNYINEVCF